jgi:hypothetical protein
MLFAFQSQNLESQAVDAVTKHSEYTNHIGLRTQSDGEAGGGGEIRNSHGISRILYSATVAQGRNANTMAARRRNNLQLIILT